MGHWVNDPSVPGGRRYVEDGQGVETLQSGPVLNWEGEQSNVPDTAPQGFGQQAPTETVRRPPGGGPAMTIDWGDLGRRIQHAWDIGFPDRRGNTPTEGFGGNVGAGAGQHGATYEPPAPLNFGDGYLPEDQALISALEELRNTAGATTTVTAPQLPPIPEAMFEVDPGFERLVTHAENRQTQIEQLISSMRGDREGEVARATNKWSTLGRWLSQVAAVDDLSQGGVIMERVLRDNRDMQAELRQETLQYIQMGWSAEDAVIQAQTALLSGQAAARRELAAAQYQRGTAQTQLDFSASTANAENASRGATARANASVAIAEASRDAASRAREQRTQAAQALSTSPQYSRQAFGEIASGVTDDPGTQGALTGVMEEQQLNSALMGYVAQYAGASDARTRRQGLQFLRQWDPTLNEASLQNSTPQQLMLRLTRSPQARAAFERNREYLIRSQQFGSMMAPAQ